MHGAKGVAGSRSSKIVLSHGFEAVRYQLQLVNRLPTGTHRKDSFPCSILPVPQSGRPEQVVRGGRPERRRRRGGTGLCGPREVPICRAGELSLQASNGLVYVTVAPMISPQGLQIEVAQR